MAKALLAQKEQSKGHCGIQLSTADVISRIDHDRENLQSDSEVWCVSRQVHQDDSKTWSQNQGSTRLRSFGRSKINRMTHTFLSLFYIHECLQSFSNSLHLKAELLQTFKM